jgi:hypothetical protein
MKLEWFELQNVLPSSTLASKKHIETITTISYRPCIVPNATPGWPDWANFRPMGDTSFWAVFLITKGRPHFCATFFHGESYALIATKKMFGLQFGIFFHLVTLRKHIDSFSL